MAAPPFAAASALAGGAALAPSAIWAALALFLFFWFIARLARCAPASALLLAPLIVLRASELVSGVAIEAGARMVETATRGAPSGAFAHLLLLDIVTLGAASLLIERHWQRLAPTVADAPARWAPAAATLATLLALTIAAASIVLGLLAIRHGIPLFDRIDRFTYLGDLAGSPYRTIMMNRLLAAPLIGVLIALPRWRRRGSLLLCWLLLVSLLFGEKFTSLLMIGGAAAIPPGLVRIATRKPLPRLTLLLPLVFAVISLPAILVNYGALEDGPRAWQRLGERAAVQGQLWFLADRTGPPARPDSRALHADVASWAHPAAQHAERAGSSFGLYYVMARFTPSHRLKTIARTGNGFVFAFYPYLLLAGGVPILLLGAVAVALLQALALTLLAEALAAGRWLAAIAFTRVVAATYACLVTGFLWNAFGIKTLATLALGTLLLRLSSDKFRVNKISLNAAPRSA